MSVPMSGVSSSVRGKRHHSVEDDEETSMPEKAMKGSSVGDHSFFYACLNNSVSCLKSGKLIEATELLSEAFLTEFIDGNIEYDQTRANVIASVSNVFRSFGQSDIADQILEYS